MRTYTGIILNVRTINIPFLFSTNPHGTGICSMRLLQSIRTAAIVQIRNIEKTPQSFQFLRLPEAVWSQGKLPDWLQTFSGTLFLHSVVWLINKQWAQILEAPFCFLFTPCFCRQTSQKTLRSIWPTMNHVFHFEAQKKAAISTPEINLPYKLPCEICLGKSSLTLCRAEDCYRIHRQEIVSEPPEGNSVTYISNMKSDFVGQCWFWLICKSIIQVLLFVVIWVIFRLLILLVMATLYLPNAWV